MSTTPNALPVGTFVQLGELMGTSMSLKGCRNISHIETRGYFNSQTRKPNYYVDIEVYEEQNKTSTIRSHRTNLTKRQARDLQRNVTRKIAMFLFENRQNKKAA